MEESMAIKEKDPSTAQLHLNPATGNNCSICEKRQSLNSLWEAVDDSPEFVKGLEDLKANEHGELDAKTMTLELLVCHFLKRSKFEFRNCYGPMFESCRAYSLIKKHVQERFPDVADDQFDSDVKSWFHDQYSLFEELKFVSVVDDHEQAAECVTESGETVGMLISLPKRLQESEDGYLYGILNHIFEKNAVGMVLHFGIDQEKGRFYYLIRDVVLDKFSQAFDENSFDECVKNWFSDCKFHYRTLSAYVYNSPGQDIIRNNCNLCNEKNVLRDLKKNEIEEKEFQFEASILANRHKRYFPPKPQNLVEMVHGFLDRFFLKRNPNKLILTRNCLGDKFQKCYLMEVISDNAKEVFPEDSRQDITNCVEDWFEHQLKEFYSYSKGMKIKCEESSRNKGHIDTIVSGVLDPVFKKCYIGFTLIYGASKIIPQQEIYNMIIKKYPEGAKEPKIDYFESIKKWFEC